MSELISSLQLCKRLDLQDADMSLLVEMGVPHWRIGESVLLDVDIFYLWLQQFGATLQEGRWNELAEALRKASTENQDTTPDDPTVGPTEPHTHPPHSQSYRSMESSEESALEVRIAQRAELHKLFEHMMDEGWMRSELEDILKYTYFNKFPPVPGS